MRIASNLSAGISPSRAKISPEASNAESTLRTRTLPSSRMAKYADSPRAISATNSKSIAPATML